MRKIPYAMAVAAALCGCSAGTDVPLAEKAVDSFHQTLNAGDFARIYAEARPDMKAATAEGPLVDLLGAVHRKLGVFQSGKSVGWNDNATTGGHFLTLTYASTYAGGTADERFVYRIDGGRAMLAGYNINSNALILK